MKKTVLILLLLAISGNSITAQNVLSETEKLSTTAKIWGFLKYYHPIVIKGKYDWDYELVKRMSEINELKTSEDFSEYYLKWIFDLGSVVPNKKQNVNSENDYFLKNLDLDWVENSSVFNEALKQQLNIIRDAERSNKQHYVKLDKIGNSGKAIPINEKEYSISEFPEDENIRLLSLFRFWNFIEYFFPYKYQTDQSWDEVLKEMIPEFKNASKSTKYHLAMLRLTTKLDDSHSSFSTTQLENYFGKNWLPVSVKIIDDKAVVTGFYNINYAQMDNWEIGDAITKINKVDISDIYNDSKDLVNGSNEKAKQRMATFKLFRSNEESIEITVEKNGKSIDKSVSLYPLNEMKERNFNRLKWKILEDNIGYINLGLLRVKEVRDIVENLSNTKSIIIDIRNYPLGTKDAIVAELSEKEQECFKSIMPDLSKPGRFVWRKARKKAGRKNKDPYKGKIILLVNEETISYAELTCMCLQTLDNVTVIGSQTAGADGNVTELKFIGGFDTNISGIGMFYPNGKETQRIGIEPDITIEQTISGIKNGRDEILEKAIEVANE
jgi:C-terminal processing protease CtpA/Prc